MDWSATSPFGVLKEHLAWLGQRQQILARNIANADTPGYAPRDLEPVRFGDMVHRSTPPVRVATTVSGHLGGSRRPTEFVEREQPDATDATPARRLPWIRVPAGGVGAIIAIVRRRSC